MAKPDNEARNALLGRVRGQLGVRADDIVRRAAVNTRLRAHAQNLIPERAKKPRAELIRQFQEMLELSGAKVSRVRTFKAVPEAVAQILRDNNLPSQVRLGADPFFDGLRAEPGMIELRHGPAQGDDLVSLSHAMAGASETGTLFLTSGPNNPSTLNFLPETHIACIAADDIHGSYEDCWAALRDKFGQDVVPRTINLVSGPSRTADIEQTIVQGAHGPKRLFVVIAGS